MNSLPSQMIHLVLHHRWPIRRQSLPDALFRRGPTNVRFTSADARPRHIARDRQAALLIRYCASSSWRVRVEHDQGARFFHASPSTAKSSTIRSLFPHNLRGASRYRASSYMVSSMSQCSRRGKLPSLRSAQRPRPFQARVRMDQDLGVFCHDCRNRNTGPCGAMAQNGRQRQLIAMV